jgi:hypothetical protein
MQNKKPLTYKKLKATHKDIYDQLSFAEFTFINLKSFKDVEDPSTYATRQFKGLFADFEVEDVVSFAKLAIEHNFFDFPNENSPSEDVTRICIVAHYRSQLDRWFYLLSKGYTPILPTLKEIIIKADSNFYK